MHFPGKAQASAVGSGVDIATALDLKTIDFPRFSLASGLPGAPWQGLLHECQSCASATHRLNVCSSD